MLSAIEGGCPHPHRHRHCTTCNNPRNERGARRTLPNLPKEAA